MRVAPQRATRALFASLPVLLAALAGQALAQNDECPPQCLVNADGNRLRIAPRSMAQMRATAWGLFVPFTKQAEGLPAEPDWMSVTDIPEPQSAERSSMQFKLNLRPKGLIESHKLYEAAFLNRAAWDYTVRMPTTRELKQQFAREISLPPHSMAIKMFFYRVEPGERIDVRLWDWNGIKVSGAANLDASGLRTQCVRLQASPGCIPARDSFYMVRVTKENLDVFTCGLDCVSDLQDGDELIMVGMHIASKQTPEWLWATFWWRGPDDENLSGDFWTCQDAQRPESIASIPRWRNYSMDVTASLNLLKPKLAPNDKDRKCGSPPVLGGTDRGPLANQEYLATYNPFVEADFTHGLKSSCVNCHARASTAENNGEPPEFADITSPTAQDFEWHIRLDYLWSLTRRHDRTHRPRVE